MHEGLYKGRRVEDGKWVEGFLIAYKDETYIIEQKECELSLGDCYFDGSVEKVVPETVGEYTGVVDESGKKIFEWDIVELYLRFAKSTVRRAVVYEEKLACWTVKPTDKYVQIGEPLIDLDVISGREPRWKVIGNVHDDMVFEKDNPSTAEAVPLPLHKGGSREPITLEEANKVFEKNYVDVMNAAMVESSLLENVSATGALSKLNQDRLDALASVVGTSFFKGDRK